MFNLYRLIIGALFLSIAFSSSAITPEKSADLKVLMELLDVSSMPEQMADMMVTQTILIEKKHNPKMSKEVEEIISSVIHDLALEKAPDLFRMAEPLYDKYYTHSEIRELIKFFDSPIGRKYNAVLQPMMNDLVPIAQKWGQELGPIAVKEVARELKRRGYE
jgi:hypothetical protein